MKVLVQFLIHGADGVRDRSEKFCIEGLPVPESYNLVVRNAEELRSVREDAARMNGGAGEKYQLATVHVWGDDEPPLNARCIHESLTWEQFHNLCRA